MLLSGTILYNLAPHPLNVMNTVVSQTMTGYGLNDDVNNQQFGLDNALLTNVIPDLFQWNWLNAEQSCVLMSILCTFISMYVHSLLSSYNLTFTLPRDVNFHCDPLNMRQTACRRDTH